eukprot:TRINITY_DN2053_c0_g1_i2.p1 TRINITY_DN2053_c0_g1~~TRINITY_DN2053_c0_g1_i2.p1  ORF type:complete len:647 (-),score=137.67 TRINITY_DN2053_c0_g1_i2:275-2215(-)
MTANNTTLDSNSSEESPAPSELDIIEAEINAIRELIELQQKKIDFLTQLRQHFAKNNLTVPSINESFIEQLISSRTFSFQQAIGGRQAQKTQQVAETATERPSAQSAEIRGGAQIHGETSFMNRLIKRSQHKSSSRIVDVDFVLTRQFRSVDDNICNSLIIALTVDSKILILDQNGHYLTEYDPGHFVLTMRANPHNDEIYFITLGSDNRLKHHTVEIYRLPPIRNANPGAASGSPPSNQVINITISVEFSSQIFPTLMCSDISNEETVQKCREHYSLLTHMARGLKYIVVSDQQGEVNVFHRNGTHKGSFKIEGEKINGLIKSYPNPAYYTNKLLGFFNPVLVSTTAPNCESSGDEIIHVAQDAINSNLIYVLMKNLEILVYEIRSGTPPSCKVSYKMTGAIRYKDTAENPKLAVFRGHVIFIPNKNPSSILIYNTTELAYGNYVIDEPLTINFHQDDMQASDVQYFAYKGTVQSSYMVTIRNIADEEGEQSHITLFEYLVPPRSSSDWLSNMRFPIVVLSLVFAVGYQVWKRGSKKTNLDDLRPGGKQDRERFAERRMFDDLAAAGRSRRNGGEPSGTAGTVRFADSDVNQLNNLYSSIEGLTRNLDRRGVNSGRVGAYDDVGGNMEEEEEDISYRKRKQVASK